MTEEEYFRKNYPDSCYGDKPLSPHWDFFQDGVEFGERQSEKKIEELEKENAELKLSCKIQVDTAFQMIYEKDDQLTKAKEIIKGLLFFVDSLGNYSGGIFNKAEQFLDEVEK